MGVALELELSSPAARVGMATAWKSNCSTPIGTATAAASLAWSNCVAAPSGAAVAYVQNLGA